MSSYRNMFESSRYITNSNDLTHTIIFNYWWEFFPNQFQYRTLKIKIIKILIKPNYSG